MTLPPGWQADIIKGLGGQHSAGAEHLLGAWQQWEGGGTANDASFNPLNTTRGKYQKINSVGVSAFPDWATGIQETVGTLGGYPAISEALRTGQVDFSNPALQADFNKWLTGKAEPGMTPYVAKIARSFGQDVPLSETRAATNSVPPPPPVGAAPAAAPAEGRISFMDVALGKKSIMDMFFQKRAAPSSPAPAVPSAAPTSPGSAASPAAGAGQGGWTPMPNASKWVSMAPGADREGVHIHPEVLDFVGQIGSLHGRPLTIGTGTAHNQYVKGTHRESAHWTGRGADIPAEGKELTRLGQDALIAAGMAESEARQQTGGVFNVGGKNILFNTNVGGNHYNHLHVGLSH